MSLAEAIETCCQKYAEFRGRAARPEFWWFFLLYYILIVAPLVPLIALGSAASDNTPFDKSAGVAGARFAVLTGVAFFALILPNAAAGTRRLHDTGKPGGGGSSRLSRSVRSSCSCSGRAPGTVGGTSTDRLQASRRLNPPRQGAPCRRHRHLRCPHVALSLHLSKHPHQHRSEGAVLLAVDQQLG